MGEKLKAQSLRYKWIKNTKYWLQYFVFANFFMFNL